MKAFTIEKFGTIDHLQKTEVATPLPEPGEIQIKIAYSGVNPVDWKIVEGKLKERLPHEFPLIPGWDAAGVVSALGEGVDDFQLGDKVFAYCRMPKVKWGTYAEFICIPARNVARKPSNLSFAQAASIPLVTLTAWQSLFDVGGLKAEQTVLIHAGAGGVGSMAIQLARHAKAKIYTTAQKKNHAYVKSLGADVAIDYTEEDFAKKVRELSPKGIDLVFDTIGGKTLEESLKTLKPKGKVVSIIGLLDEKVTKPYDITMSYVFVRPDGAELQAIGDLIEKGKIVAPSIQEIPFAEAQKAQKISKDGHTQGKLVLRIG